ncbi:hypothetical protein Tco_1415629 [Tanacetum coccineum]
MVLRVRIHLGMMLIGVLPIHVARKSLGQASKHLLDVDFFWGERGLYISCAVDIEVTCPGSLFRCDPFWGCYTTPPSYSSGPSTPPSYSQRSSRNAECSNCKNLHGKISVLKAIMEMHMHPEQHIVNLAALFHEVLNKMEKLDLE